MNVKDLITNLLNKVISEHAEAGCDNDSIRDTGVCPHCEEIESYKEEVNKLFPGEF